MGIFKVLIAKALNEVVSLQSQGKINLTEEIEQTIINFFTQVIKIGSFTLRQEVLEQGKVHF